jgi:starvation-inducible outer membrane lipoprotein
MEAADGGYRVVVSELPFDGSSQHRPAVDQLPRGRFILLTRGLALPSDLRPGAEITVVGEILGADTLPEGGVDDRVPLLEGRYIKVWGPSWWPRFLIGVSGGISI